MYTEVGKAMHAILEAFLFIDLMHSLSTFILYLIRYKCGNDCLCLLLAVLSQNCLFGCMNFSNTVLFMYPFALCIEKQISMNTIVAFSQKTIGPRIM